MVENPARMVRAEMPVRALVVVREVLVVVIMIRTGPPAGMVARPQMVWSVLPVVVRLVALVGPIHGMDLTAVVVTVAQVEECRARLLLHPARPQPLSWVAEGMRGETVSAVATVW